MISIWTDPFDPCVTSPLPRWLRSSLFQAKPERGRRNPSFEGSADVDRLDGRRKRQREDEMYARVATFESDPSKVDDAIEMVRSEVEGEAPEGLKGAKMLMLVDRESGKGIGVTLFESEEAMRKGDEALNAMNPGGTERRVSVEFFEVPVQTVA